MKRYKLVNRGGGQVTLMDTEGNLTYVNEGVFHDAYAKIKDFVKSKAVKFEEIGGRIVAYIGGVVAKAITVFDVARQNVGKVFLFATGATASKAEKSDSSYRLQTDSSSKAASSYFQRKSTQLQTQ